MPLAGPSTRSIDLNGRRVLPGLIDNHLHIIRGGLSYNMELRWDGVRSLADAMAMLKRQVAVTPPPQWVRVVGGFTEHQFAEKRLPTIEELNAAAPDTPVFLLHLYDRALLNAAALRVIGYTKDTPEPPAARSCGTARQSDRAAGGQAECQHSLRDARQRPQAAARLSGQFHAPLHARAQPARRHRRARRRRRLSELSARLRGHPKACAMTASSRSGWPTTCSRRSRRVRKHDFLNWTKTTKYKQGNDYFRHNGAGEMLVFSAADFEDFRQPRPDLPPEMEPELDEVVRILATNRWPWRMHATYDETISRALDVFERVNQDIPLDGLNWFFDHAETISDRSIDRIAALGGGIAVQHRMAYQGEYFVERYGLALPKRPRRSSVSSRRALKYRPGPTPRGSRPTIPGSRWPGW